MFYTYTQNNSGGAFIFRRKEGITHFVIIEADSATDANSRAERIGLYFGGEGDCACCGDRWYPFYSDVKGDRVPSVYGKRVTKASTAKSLELHIKWMDNKPEVFVHYKSGRILAAVTR